MRFLPHFTIRTFAVICVAVCSAYVMWLGWKINDTLSGPGWCATALGAGKATSVEGTVKGLDACVGLLTIQLKSLSTNSHILLGTIALSLGVLIVIVVAGAKFAGAVGPGGASANVSPANAEPIPAATVAAAAAGAAAGATAGAAAANTPPTPGPAMPPPPGGQ
jgi:hypothetical protein